MADLATLNVAGPVRLTAPGTDPAAPVLQGNLKVWVSAAPATKTSPGSPGNYFSDGDYFWICYATNQWSRGIVAADWT